jgi:8-amino-7-oxononanoate synthase
MDIFKKCYQFTRANDMIAMGLMPFFQVIEQNEGPVVRIAGRDVLMAGSNNYLGLSKHPEVIEAAVKATKEFGTSCSGSRFLNGTLVLHTALEEELADFVGMEKCLLFTTGFLTNQGIIPTLVGRNEYIVSDKDNHASIVAGNLIAKALSAHVLRYKTNDMADLEHVLKRIPKDAPKLIVSDGVYSMSGQIVNLPELVKLAKHYHARTMIDEAHSVGVLGMGGIGVCDHFGLKNGTDIDIIMGTFSKSFASLGGFAAGEARVIDYIKYNSQALRFSASMAPANVAAVQAALRIIKREPERISRLHEITRYVRQGCIDMGLRVIETETPIVPIIVGDDMKTFQIWRRLLDEGVFTNAVIAPAAPQGLQIIRASFIATLENKHLDQILEKFAKVGKEFGLIS